MAPRLQTSDIPSATVQCHASNLLQLPDKTLLCAWFGGSQEGLPDICIWLSRLDPDSMTWSEPRKVSWDNDRSCQNPVLFRDPDSGRLWLFHTSQEAGNQDEAYVVARTSGDAGLNWSEPFLPLKGKRGIFVRQPLVVLEDGAWVLPVFYCRTTPGYRWVGNDDISGIFYSQDQGETWHEKQYSNSIGAVHMNIIPPVKGSLSWLALYRSRWADNIYRSTSQNATAWEEPRPTSLPNPNSGICAARTASGKLIIAFNQSAAVHGAPRREGLYDDITPADDTRPNQEAIGKKRAIWGTPRKALALGISDDDGITWKDRVLEDGDGFCMTNSSSGRENRELSYPSIWVEKGGIVHIAFTFHRQYIRYMRIEDVEGWIAQGQE